MRAGRLVTGLCLLLLSLLPVFPRLALAQSCETALAPSTVTLVFSDGPYDGWVLSTTNADQNINWSARSDPSTVIETGTIPLGAIGSDVMPAGTNLVYLIDSEDIGANVTLCPPAEPTATPTATETATPTATATATATETATATATAVGGTPTATPFLHRLHLPYVTFSPMMTRATLISCHTGGKRSQSLMMAFCSMLTIR